jgi:mRNA-degrading endonuclease RelE of RelBE toxin-antitoxin system
MNFEQTPEFQKDLKRLSKKWRSLPDDIKAAQRDILPLYIEQEGVDIVRLREAFFGGYKAAILTTTDSVEVVKMRLDVADLGRNDKVRIIFVAVKSHECITFIELYAKNEKSREDQARIKRYL